MNANTHEFLNYMGYREMLIENKIDECLEELARAGGPISIDRGELTDEEAAYVIREVERRCPGDS